ncbi:hypothetical protein ACFXKC_52540 [Streptomyces sp. NPDC059340]|uniref:hypothetical protein n=1 Tax=Streptomyces sp. NPDC059340 TaxID=3346806 RepID=UPI0036BC8647
MGDQLLRCCAGGGLHLNQARVAVQHGEQARRLGGAQFRVQIDDGEPGGAQHDSYRVSQFVATAVQESGPDGFGLLPCPFEFGLEADLVVEVAALQLLKGDACLRLRGCLQVGVDAMRGADAAQSGRDVRGQGALDDPVHHGVPVDRVRNHVPDLLAVTGHPASNDRLAQTVHEDRHQLPFGLVDSGPPRIL